MWSEFRKIDTRRQGLVTLREEMEEREAIACEKADRVEKEVFRMTRKYGRLVQEKEEWMAEAKNLAEGTPDERRRKKIAREALKAIMNEIHQLAARTYELDKERWHYRAEELRAEDGQGELEEGIERLRAELEEILARGCD